jgi:hypothetical protein
MTKLRGTYYNKTEFTYYSERYDKWVTVPKGYESDGSSGGFDINSRSWWCHDILKEFEVWDDGSACSNTQASFVIYDILKSEGRWFRARTWFIATLAWGTVVR